MEEIAYRGLALAGFLVISFVAWMTGNKGQLNKKTIVGSVFLAWVAGGMTFWLPWTRSALEWINNALISILQASQKGSIFLFGPLAIGPGQTLANGTQSIGFVLAMQVLPSVIFFFCRNQFIVLSEYYTNVCQWIC